MDDPKTTRLLQTRDGVARIPRTQEGIPLKDYFQNVELPDNLDRAVVYVTRHGPVLAKPDPVAWNEEHDKAAEEYAEKLKSQIDERGYYAKTLNIYAGRLADSTGYSSEEMKALIVSKFETAFEKQPFEYLQESREAKGLPTRTAQSSEIEHDPEV